MYVCPPVGSLPPGASSNTPWHNLSLSDIFHIFKIKLHYFLYSEISVASADLIIGVVNIALSFSQVHWLRLDPLVPIAHLRVSTVVGVATVLVRGSGAVATVGDVHVHRVELLDGGVDVVPQGRSGSC